MAYSITDLKSELTGVLHGTTLNQVQGLDVLINRAGRKLLEEVDPMETIRLAEISSPIFDQVYDYPIPADVKGDRVIDIRPQVDRTMRDRFFQTYNMDFDMTKFVQPTVDQFTVQFNTYIKSLRISANLISPLVLNTASSITDNGTWATGANTSNLTVDNVNFVAAGGSLRFDLNFSAVPTTGYIVNSTQTPVDLSRDVDQGSEFLYVFIPDVSVVNYIELQWGSSPTDYWVQTASTAQNGVAFQTGWNLVQFPWINATVVGSPDVTQVTFVQPGINYDGTATPNFRFNNIVSQLGSIFQIEYYSKFLFRDFLTGAFQENVTDDSNLINLDTDSYNVLFNLVAYYCAQQIQGSNANFDASYFKNEYENDLKRYKAKIKSQVIKPSSQYYPMPNITNRTYWIRSGN